MVWLSAGDVGPSGVDPFPRFGFAPCLRTCLKHGAGSVAEPETAQVYLGQVKTSNEILTSWPGSQSSQTGIRLSSILKS